MDAEAFTVSKLAGSSSVTTLVGARIYGVPPQDKDYPLIGYTREGSDPSQTLGGASRPRRCEVRVNAYAEALDDAVALADAVRAALDRQTGDGIQGAFWQDRSVETGEGVVTVSQLFSVWES